MVYPGNQRQTSVIEHKDRDSEARNQGQFTGEEDWAGKMI